MFVHVHVYHTPSYYKPYTEHVYHTLSYYKLYTTELGHRWLDLVCCGPLPQSVVYTSQGWRRVVLEAGQLLLHWHSTMLFMALKLYQCYYL